MSNAYLREVHKRQQTNIPYLQQDPGSGSGASSSGNNNGTLSYAEMISSPESIKMWTEHLEKNPGTFWILPREAHEDMAFMKAVLSGNPKFFSHVSSAIKDNYELCLSIASDFPQVIVECDRSFADDEEFVEQVCRKDPRLIRYASERIRGKIEVALWMCCRHNVNSELSFHKVRLKEGEFPLNALPDDVLENRQFWLEMTTTKFWKENLSHLPEKFKDDPTILKMACKRAGFEFYPTVPGARKGNPYIIIHALVATAPKFWLEDWGNHVPEQVRAIYADSLYRFFVSFPVEEWDHYKIDECLRALEKELSKASNAAYRAQHIDNWSNYAKSRHIEEIDDVVREGDAVMQAVPEGGYSLERRTVTFGIPHPYVSKWEKGVMKGPFTISRDMYLIKGWC